MCVGGDASSLFCSAVVALIVCVCGVGDVSSLFCDVINALYCMCVWVRMLVHCL